MGVDRMIRLWMAGSVNGGMGFLRKTMFTNLPVTSKLWKDFSSRWDTRINDFYVRRALIVQFIHALECWMSPKLGLYRTFVEWLEEHKDLVLKRGEALRSPGCSPKHAHRGLQVLEALGPSGLLDTAVSFSLLFLCLSCRSNWCKAVFQGVCAPYVDPSSLSCRTVGYLLRQHIIVAFP